MQPLQTGSGVRGVGGVAGVCLWIWLNDIGRLLGRWLQGYQSAQTLALLMLNLWFPICEEWLTKIF